MITRFLVAWFWIFLIQTNKNILVNSLLDSMPVEYVGLGNIEPERMLAPPPIYLGGPVAFDEKKQIQTIWLRGEKFILTFDPESNKLDIHGDKEPEYPYIIEAPGQRYFIKVNRERPWVQIEALAGERELLQEIIKKASGLNPPTPPGGEEGNGDDHDWYDPPFKPGDKVIHLQSENLGKMLVSDVWLRVLPNMKKLVWWVVAVYRTGNTFDEMRDFAANFKKAPEELNSAQQFEEGKE